MHYILGTIFIFGGLALQLGGAESLWLSKLDWSRVAPFLIMATGLAVIVTGGKVVRYRRRVVTKLSRAIEKIELLYDHAGLSRNDSADADYRQLHDIVRLYQASPPLYRGSQLWENLYVRHIRWIKEHGIANFKRSVNLAYFQWKIDFRNSQLVSVMRHVSPMAVLRNFLHIRIPAPLQDDVGSTPQNRWMYRLFMAGLVEKTKAVDRNRLLDVIEEPQWGNPWPVYYDGKLVSQDMCNSLIEFYSVSDVVDSGTPVTVAELGAGYGRFAYVLLKARAKAKYVIFDIPPAVFLSQWYLSRVFPEKRIFRLRSFDNFEEVRDEYERADIAFFLPEQMELFPANRFDLFVNISSLAEMRPDQIRNYYSQIGRLTRGYFYSKQWFDFVNHEDRIVMRQADYPVPPAWKEVYSRRALVQNDFFESLHKVQVADAIEASPAMESGRVVIAS